MEIPLTKGEYALIDAEDWPLVQPYVWHVEIRPGGKKYAATSGVFGGKRTTLRMHCLLLGTHGSSHRVIGEHQNGNGLDNRRENLRLASQMQNAWNSSPREKYRGVTRQKRLRTRPWQARIHRLGITHHLGYFPTEEEAATAYNEAAQLSDGQFLKLNNTSVELSDNYLRKVTKRELSKGSTGARMLKFTLSCGHVGELPWWRRNRVGHDKHCAECKRAGV